MEEFGARRPLYIEDNLSNLDLVERMLVQYPSIQVISATRGEEGLKLARQFRPDLILLDLHLPDIRGDEVLRRLRQDETTREIPVVMLSADATGDRASKMLAAGTHSYLTKPFEWPALLRAMYECLKAGDSINA